MPTTPARIPAHGSGSSSESAEPAVGIDGIGDTERPPALGKREANPVSREVVAAPRSAERPVVPSVPTPKTAPVVSGAVPPPTPPTPKGVTRLEGSRAATPRPLPPPPLQASATNLGLSPPLSPPVSPAARNTHASLAGPFTRQCTSCGELYPADFLVCPRDATPLTAVEASESDPLVGALIGDTYQIVRVVGEGGMGRVYEARHLRLKERRFAVKCLHTELARNPEMAARFLREAESASSIKHDNVVDVFDVHHLQDGTPYLVGEFLEGEELADYVHRRGPLEPRMAAKIARQVCHALAAAHERGIVHRDMKPENVFVLARSIQAVERGESRTLQVKVLDFGISKAGPSDTSHLTRTGVIMGTPSYMAPEQARGRPVDHRADVYSVGACLYFMVTGRRPFDSDDPTSTLSMVLSEEPTRPRQLDERIPEELELVIQRAMAKDERDRYASMNDFDKALAAFTGRSSIAIPSGHGIPAVQLKSEAMQVRVTGAARAFDVAKAMLGTGSLPPATQQSSELAKSARPMIVITSVALTAWLIGGTVAALAGLVRVLHEGEVTFTEAVLLVIGCVFAAGTPIGLYIAHVRKTVWPNTVRSVELATDLKRLAAAAFVTYGAVAIAGRVAHTVFLRTSHALASGTWDVALFVVSLVVAITIGGFSPLVRNLRRRRRE